jgi:hypothetical protein
MSPVKTRRTAHEAMLECELYTSATLCGLATLDSGSVDCIKSIDISPDTWRGLARVQIAVKGGELEFPQPNSRGVAQSRC